MWLLRGGPILGEAYDPDSRPKVGKFSVLVGDLQENVGMARAIGRAVAGQVASTKFTLDVVDRHRETPPQKVLAIPADCLGTTELQRMWIAPLRRSSHDDDAIRQATALTT